MLRRLPATNRATDTRACGTLGVRGCNIGFALQDGGALGLLFWLATHPQIMPQRQSKIVENIVASETVLLFSLEVG